MTLNASGIMSIGGTTTGASINLELGLAQNANSGLGQTNFRTLAGVATGAISLSNFYGKSNGASGKGYWPAGTNATNTDTNTIYGLVFATETTSSPSAVINAALNFQCSNFSSTKAYIFGGRAQAVTWPYTRINAFTLSNEAMALVTATISNNNAGACNFSNAVTYGYFAGGLEHVPSGYLYSGWTRITYSTEALTTNTAATIFTGRDAESCNSTTAGYSKGDGGSASYPCVKFLFSTETFSNLGFFKYLGNRNSGGNTSTIGYWAGGFDTVNVNTTASLLMSNDTSRTITATLPAARDGLSAPNSTLKWYNGGGFVSGTTYAVTIYPMTFTTETYATLGVSMTASHTYSASSFQSGGTL